MTQIIGETTGYLDKTKELCQAILEDPKLRLIFTGVDAFMEDDAAKAAYTSMQGKAEELHARQNAGLELTAGEIDSYNKLRDRVLSNPIARAFVDAQEEMHSVRATVNGWLGMTFELGRMPRDEDFDQEGSCGSGCGCH